MITPHAFIRSEIKELETILAGLPNSHVIDRMSLESRLAAVKEELAALPPEAAMPKKAVLTFRGKPVMGTHGISADFGTRAAAAFSDAFAAIAASLTEGLQATGPIPDKERNQLLITGTAIGSFGFEFELPRPEANAQASLYAKPEKAQEAMEKLETLLQLAAEGSDDEVASVVEEIAPRAVRKVHDFLDLLAQQQAWCGLEFAGRSFRFNSHDQLKQSSERLRADNIQEREDALDGEFQGVLPESRAFEFRLREDGSVIRGKIHKSIADPAALNREWLNQPATVTFKLMQVGQGRPRYALDSLAGIKPRHD